MRGNFLDKTKEGRLSKTAHDWGLKNLKEVGVRGKLNLTDDVRSLSTSGFA